MEYTKKVMMHFNNPKNIGEIKNADSVAQITNPICSDTMKIYLKIEKNKAGNEKIIYAKFRTMGCAAAIASSDVTCDIAKGKTLEQAAKIKDSDIVKKLGGLPPVKYHCSLLGASALKLAIKNYQRAKKKH